MNSISIHGKIVGNVETRLIKTPTGETPLVMFKVMDMGIVFHKNEPLIMEVNYLKEEASSLYEYLTPGKEVFIIGFLRQKKLKTGTKVVISADYITLLPMYDKTHKIGSIE